MRDIMLEIIDGLRLKSFDFELICQEIGRFMNKDTESAALPPEYEDIVSKVMRELVIERVICPVPHGKPTFFVNRQQ